MEIIAYIKPLIRWWWLIVLATAVAGVSSYLAVRQQPLIYQSRTTLMIGRTIDDPNPTNSEFYLSQQLAQIYADMAGREGVRNATLEALNITWLPNYSARSLPNSQLIEIVVDDTVPERAQAVANELAQQLILISPSNVQQDEQVRQAFVNEQLDNLEEQIQATQDQIQAKQAELGELFSARQIASTQSEIAALDNKLNTLQSNYASLRSTTQQSAINALDIIEPASLPTRPVGPNTSGTIITAAAIGLVLAVSAAYLLEFLDDTLKTADDVAQIDQLATIAQIARVKDASQSNLVTLEQPRSPVSESFRGLRTNIQFADIDTANKSILVTSASPGEGKSFTATNLAIVISQAGFKVLLIDGDLRRPAIHNLLGISQNRGLSSFLLEAQRWLDAADEEVLDRFVQTDVSANLHVLTSGTVPPNPSEMLGSAKMEAVLAKAADIYDYVIIDSPPVLAVTDATILSSLVDAVILVATAHKTRRGDLEKAVTKLRNVSANIVGVALNRTRGRGQGEFAYYYAADPPASSKKDGGTSVDIGGVLNNTLKKRNARS